MALQNLSQCAANKCIVNSIILHDLPERYTTLHYTAHFVRSTATQVLTKS